MSETGYIKELEENKERLLVSIKKICPESELKKKAETKVEEALFYAKQALKKQV